MGEKNILKFPYDFIPINDDEKAIFKGLYTAPNAADMVRVGPKGYLMFNPYQKDAENIYNMPLKPGDVFVSSFQRSGTTMTQELVWLLKNDLDYHRADAIPLTQRYLFLEVFMYFDDQAEGAYVDTAVEKKDDVNVNKLVQLLKIWSTPASALLAGAPSPRFVKTHLPMSLMPPKILETAKVIYLARDPRDVIVSCYHHCRLFTMTGYIGTFKEFWNLFHQNMYTMSPYFEHVKEAWEKRDDPNMLFLFYEELTKERPATILRVADFLGKQLTEQQLAGLSNHLSFRNFKNNMSVNFEDLREFGLLAETEEFVRKGGTGGWRNYFDKEMTQEANRWIRRNLRDTDLRFPHTDMSD